MNGPINWNSITRSSKAWGPHLRETRTIIISFTTYYHVLAKFLRISDELTQWHRDDIFGLLKNFAKRSGWALLWRLLGWFGLDEWEGTGTIIHSFLEIVPVFFDIFVCNKHTELVSLWFSTVIIFRRLFPTGTQKLSKLFGRILIIFNFSLTVYFSLSLCLLFAL